MVLLEPSVIPEKLRHVVLLLSDEKRKTPFFAVVVVTAVATKTIRIGTAHIAWSPTDVGTIVRLGVATGEIARQHIRRANEGLQRGKRLSLESIDATAPTIRRSI